MPCASEQLSQLQEWGLLPVTISQAFYQDPLVSRAYEVVQSGRGGEGASMHPANLTSSNLHDARFVLMATAIHMHLNCLQLWVRKCLRNIAHIGEFSTASGDSRTEDPSTEQENGMWHASGAAC